MPATAQSVVKTSRLFAEPQRALLTPSASPSVGPPDRPPAKRSRLRSTPSSSVSATPSTSNESASSTDVNSARKASTLRVLNTWAQLAERYNKRLDEDDIIDLHRFVILKDRGAVESAPKGYDIGHYTRLVSGQDCPDAEQDQDDSEQDDDENELNALPPSDAATDDDAPISKKELLRGVPPLSATTDAEDLREFLEAEKKRRELAGDEEDDEEMSPEQRSALRKELAERLQRREAAVADDARDATSTEPAAERDADTTPTRRPASVPPLDDESEDELGLWTHDESTAVYSVPRDESEQDVREVEREVIELTDTDSDEEFEAILTHPPRFARGSPATPLREVPPPFQSPPDSERRISKARTHPRPAAKLVEVALESNDRPSSPLVHRKPQVVLPLKGKPTVLKVASDPISDDEGPDEEVVGRISSAVKGKGKAILPPAANGPRDKKPKSLGVASPSRKRKRISSTSTTGTPPASSPGEHSSPVSHSVSKLGIVKVEPKNRLRSHSKSISQSCTTLLQHKPALDKEVSTPVRFEATVASPSRSLSSLPSASKFQPSISPATTYRHLEPESVQLTSHDRSSSGPLLSDLSSPVTYPFNYYQRHPSQPPSTFTSPGQGTPGLSLSSHPPPLMEPVQAQHAHYLLAQAMHQLTYLLSATMPSHAPYAPTGQPWQHPPPPLPPHAAYSTPIYHPHAPASRHYHTPSSSTSHSGLPPSSPVRSSESPPIEEQSARNRARSKPLGRRVSFKLETEGVSSAREHTIQPEAQHGGQRGRNHNPEGNHDRGKGKMVEELDDALRIEGRGSPSRDSARGRTPGPPSRKKVDVSRGRSLGLR